MGVFNEACFCDLLRERLNKEWNEIIEGAKKKQKEKLEELEEKIKAWKDAGLPSSFEGIKFYKEGEGLFSPEDALRNVREYARKTGIRSKVFIIARKKDSGYTAVDTLIIGESDTLESLRMKLEKKYEELLEEYKRTRESLAPFIDWDRLRNVGEIAALKKQVC